MMLHIPGVLSPAQVASMRARIDGAGWGDGRATVGQQGARVKHNRQLPAATPLAQALAAEVAAALAGGSPAGALYFAAALPLRASPALINGYAGGEHYGDHVDGAVRAMPGGAAPLRTDLSATLFLTDPASYDGGELIVADTYGEHEVKLDAGDMILYPASSVHRVEPVTRGERVCAFFWIQSMVRDDARRAMLLELDRTITSLRARIGDCAETVTLTSQYHNLLRMWADV